MKKDTSTKQMERWAKTKCHECGGHGGGHFEDCPKKKNPAAISLGSIKTEKKAISSRKNGKKGGRPDIKDNIKKYIAFFHNDITCGKIFNYQIDGQFSANKWAKFNLTHFLEWLELQ